MTVLLAMAAVALALPAAAVRLGEMRVHSSTGEPLDATFALTPSPGETLDPDCFFLGRARATDLLIAARATFAVESDGAAPRLRLRTGSLIPEVELRLRIHASCPGGRSVTRDYTARLDAPASLQPVTAPAAAPTPVAATAPVAHTGAGPEFRALSGDTLASIAAAIYPGNASARAAYVQAIRSENPGLAGLADDDALPPGTMFTLPDLRKFSLGYAAVAKARPRPTEVPKRPAAAAPPPAPKADLPKLPKATVDLPKAPVAKVEPKASPAALPTAPRSAAGAFVLKLSSPEIDLSRSRGIDERKRAQIRERRLALDADDHVAVLLAMRNDVKKLEGRVAELQLKLSALPPAAAAPASAPAASPAPPAKAPAPPPAMAPTPPPAMAPAPAPAMTPAPVAAPPAPPAPAPQPAVAPKSPPAQQDFIPVWLWGVLALLAAAVGAAVWWMRSRPRPAAPEPLPAPVGVSDLDVAEALMRAADGVAPQTPDQAGEHRFVADSDASLATRVPGADPVALRLRYIEERFPEITGGTIVLDEPESVVKAARLFYEDGAVARAVELLQFAVEERPAAMKPWLALFEIFRLEGLPGEFAELAGRFREHHAESDSWRKVQFIGREFDPQNPLYRDEAFNSLETIGPTAPKRAPVTFDALAENWLNAPMDFTTDALASSLRAAMLADAGLQDADLLPDPMPALKNVEMFNVA